MVWSLGNQTFLGWWLWWADVIISLFLAGLYHGVHHQMMLFINITHFLSIRFYTCQETLLPNFRSRFSCPARGGVSLESQLLRRLRREDHLSLGVIGCSEQCRAGVRTKLGINMVTSREWGSSRLPRQGEPAQVGKGAGQNSGDDQ